MDYGQFIATTAFNCGTDSSDENFAASLPGAIDYAEDRIYRDPAFNFLVLNTAGYSDCVTGSRTLARPATVLITEGINILTPVGATSTDPTARRMPLERVSLAFLDQVWGYGSGDPEMIGIPTQYAPLTDSVFIVGAVPDAAYVAEFLGPTRPLPLSATNRTNFLTLNMPALYVAAAMVYFCGAFLRNFGAQSDNPQQAQSWETQYNLLKTGPAVEEARRKSESASWQSRPPTLAAKPER